MKRILTTLMTIMLMMGMAGSAETVYQEIPLPVSAQPTFYTCTDASGNTYDLFEIVFAYDVSQEDAAFDFWFITVRIALNDAGEIAYMEYEYVPWG